MSDATRLPVDAALCAGFDVGGTKVTVLDSKSGALHRYNTTDFASMDAILEHYFLENGSRPARVALAMAGPRDDETGAVTLTNGDWPAFEPAEAAKRYPGTSFETVNDMIGTTAGVLTEQGVDLTELKSGTPSATGTKLVLAVSTGFGAAAALWDKHTGRYVYLPSEGGHIGIQPEDLDEAAYLKFLQQKYPHVSAELALSGKEGIENLIDHALASADAPQLAAAVQRARADGRPVGAVLLEFATEGTGADAAAARRVLQQLGNMLGSAIRDLAVAFKATGGIYLTGSYILALGEYFAAETGLLKRFVHAGATHDSWIGKIPMYLVTDPHVAVKGALKIAKER